MKALYVKVTAPRMLATRVLARLSKRGAYFGPLAPLREEDIPWLPVLEPHHVRVRNRLGGICGSDIHFVQADGDFRIAPAALPGITRIYLGHELVGDVVEVGLNQDITLKPVLPVKVRGTFRAGKGFLPLPVPVPSAMEKGLSFVILVGSAAEPVW